MHIQTSRGLALFPQDGGDLEALMRSADVAMYQAKATGGGFAFYRSLQDPFTLERLRLQAALRQAIGEEALVLHYQPILDLAGGKVDKLEALVRWPRERGVVPPGVFIPLAEEGGMIRELDRLVPRRATREVVDLGGERGGQPLGSEPL